MAISLDGRELAVVTTGTEAARVWWRPLSSESFNEVEGTEGATFPFWSADGGEVGFFADGKLKAVKVPSGPVRFICETPAFFGGTWNSQDLILFSNGTTLLRVSASGGPATQVAAAAGPPGIAHFTWPQFLPDQKQFVYFGEAVGGGTSGMFLASLNGGPARLILKNRTRGAFASPDRILFVREGTLFAQKLNGGHIELIEKPVALARNVNSLSAFGQAAFSVSASSVVVYRTTESETSQLTLYNRDGRRIRNLGPPGYYRQFAMSPDEKVAALNVKVVSDRLEAEKIWLLRLNGEVISRLDFGGLANTDPVWSPNSHQIAFASFQEQGQATKIFRWSLGDSEPKLLLDNGSSNKPDDWSQAGFLLCRRNNVAAFSLPVQPPTGVHDLGDQRIPMDQLHISPDGTRVAFNTLASSYNADRSIHPDVFVATFPGFRDKIQVSTDGGVQPFWSRQGRDLFYLAMDGTLMRVEMETGRKSVTEPKTPEVTFRSSVQPNQWRSQYSVSPDGQRVYMLEPVRPQEDVLHVITGLEKPWSE